MAIVQLDQTTFLGSARDKDAVLSGLQDLGCVHLVNLRTGEVTSDYEPALSEEARSALRYLRGAPIRRRRIGDPSGFDLDAVVRDTLAVKENERLLSEEREQLVKHLRALEPWGDFRPPEWLAEKGLRFWFYAVPHHLLDRLPPGEVWHEANRDHRFVYVVALGDREPPGMPVRPTPVEAACLSDLRARLDRIDYELEELTFQRARLSAWRHLLQRALAEADDHAARTRAAEQCLEEGGVLALAGWAPRGQRKALRDFAAKHGLAFEAREPGPDDNPPTLLANPPAVAAGADCMTFYRTPPYETWDPSAVVFFSFGVFFAMILADAGYGLVLGLVVAARWRALGGSDLARRMRRLMLFMAAASVAYGVLLGSYFGYGPPFAWLGALKILDVNDQAQQMPLAITIGVLHIVAANLACAWNVRNSVLAFSYFGWALIVTGGLLAGFGFYDVGPAALLRGTGIGMLALGGVGVLLFSSRREWPPRSIWAVLGRLVDGVREAPRLSNAFGDVLSYLRLFALGLASARLAETFNSLADTAGQVPGIGLLFAALILLVGHGLNLALAVMGGVVHGLRLNCIEFFNWGLPDEGYPFRAFAKRAGS
jgi:V/A-type H+-transporting ATPase subunit I